MTEIFLNIHQHLIKGFYSEKFAHWDFANKIPFSSRNLSMFLCPGIIRGHNILYSQNIELPSPCYFIYLINRSSRISDKSHGLFQHRYFWNVYVNRYCDSSYLNTKCVLPANDHYP